MRPLRIEVTNFGAIHHAVIDLIAINVASICGPNGSGKSTAITIAPMFALFGGTKGGCSVDDMVRTGATEASVTFDFDHHGDVWRVIRTRSTKGKGKSTLELQRLTECSNGMQGWSSESGASIAETQKKIIQLLNLDEETFSSSSMILQGDAGNFTKRPAGQRKAILAQILQLEQYESLQEKARAKVQEVNISLEKTKSKVADIDSRLAAKPSIEVEKLQIELQLVSLDNTIKQGEASLQVAMVEHSSLVARIKEADKLRTQAEAIATETKLKQQESDRQNTRLKTAEQLLGMESVILSKVDEHDQAKERVTVLKTKQCQLQTIADEATRLKGELSTVEQSWNTVTAKITKIETNLADRPRLEKRATDYQQAINDFAACQKKKDEDARLLHLLNLATANLAIAESGYKTQLKAKEWEIKNLNHTAAMLDDAQCINIDQAQCRFLADAKAARDKAVKLQDELPFWIGEQDNIITDLQAKESAAHDALDEVSFDLAEYTSLQKLVVDLKPDAELFVQLHGMVELLESLKTQREELETRQIDLNTRLGSMRNQYKELSDSTRELPELESRLTYLEPWLKSKEQLPAAKEVAATAREIIDRLTIEITDAQVKEAALHNEYLAMIGDAETLLEQSETVVKSAQDELKKHRDDHTHLASRLGGLQGKLASLAQDEEQRLALVAEMEPLAKLLTRWQLLVKAFGRDGIPALIIENAVPELERIANDILGQMSGGKNFLRFETQRELKSGKGMTETLDIIVGDYAGERIYETFSGGEQLRIDFAIRFALAELLARRAGARIDWLTIDEGFGSQSDEYLPAVIDAVKSVANRFGLVLVISHVKAVQEAFEQKITFWPTADGVEVQVA